MISTCAFDTDHSELLLLFIRILKQSNDLSAFSEELSVYSVDDNNRHQ